MKKYLIGLLIAIVVAAGLYLAFHKQAKLGSYYSSVGAIVQTDPTFVNVLSGTLVIGNGTNCGNSGNIFTTTSSITLTPAQFLSVCNQLITGSSGNVTTTFPAATSTYAVS